jgi:hypothetical protein
MIGSVRLPRPHRSLTGNNLRRFNREVAAMDGLDAPGLVRIGGNEYLLPTPSRRLMQRSPHLRGMMGGFHPALDGTHFTITPYLFLEQQTGTEFTQVDLSSRVTAFTIRNSINDAMGSARVTLQLGQGITSLSPFFDTTIYKDANGRPILDPGTKVLLGVTINSQVAPDASTPVVIFAGRLDRVNAKAGPGLVEVQCRDHGAFYQNVTVRGNTSYGTSPDGREASLVMGDILTDYGFDPGDLLALADPDWFVIEYPQAEMGLLDALRAIARQAGRDVRYFSSVAKLVYYTPNRVDMTSDLIIMPNRYEDIVALEVGDEDVRNYWDVYYQGVDGARHGPLTAQDPDSILRYGNGHDRYARINLGLADNVRDDSRAQQFADAALADTKDPFISHACRMLFEPRVELNDIHYYSANNVEYDNNLKVAVAEYTHEYANGHGMTTVSGRASRAAAYRAYRKYPAKPYLVALTAADDADGMPEGTVHYQVTDLAF